MPFTQEREEFPLHRKPTFIVLVCLLVTMAATAADANAPLPSQTGPGASTDGDAAYMPDRVLVQLKPASASRVRTQMSTAPAGAVLGIPSLDAIGAQVGAIRAVPAIATPRNSSVATALGLDD